MIFSYILDYKLKHYCYLTTLPRNENRISGVSVESVVRITSRLIGPTASGPWAIGSNTAMSSAVSPGASVISRRVPLLPCPIGIVIVGEMDDPTFDIFATVHIQLVCPLRIVRLPFPVFWNENFVATFPPLMGISPRFAGIVVVTTILPSTDVFIFHEGFKKGINT
jgi:hypothetical protein